MNCIKDAFAKIEDLKISISEAFVLHALNNLNSYLWPYFAILSHNAQQKETLLTLSELTKILEDKQMRFSNKNRKIINYAYSSKPEKRKLSEQGRKGDMEKRLDNKGENKKQEVKECKTGKRKH